MAASILLGIANQQLHNQRRSAESQVAPSRPAAIFHLTVEPDPPADESHPVHPSSLILPPSSIPTYPDLNAAARRAGDIKTYRLWLILHHRYNRIGGRQLAHNDEIKQYLCTGENKLFTGRYWRQLRNAGIGRYWDYRADGRLYIYGSPRVAEQLCAGLLRLNRVAIAEEVLRGPIGDVRAALYATLHAARDQRPISRDTLNDLTGLSTPSMLRYEAQLSIEVYTNYELLADAQNGEEAAWRYKQATFKFTDSKGLQGRPGATYICRQMPNSYRSNMQILPQGRRRKINRQLRGRVTKRRAGTAEVAQRRYFDDAPKAARALNRGAQHVSYPSEVDQFWNNFFIFDGSEHSVTRSKRSNTEARQRRLPLPA